MSEIIVPKKRMSPKVKWGLAFAIFTLILTVVIVGLAIYVGWNLTHPERQLITQNPSQFELKYEDIRFQNRDAEGAQRVDLKGWYVPAEKPNGVTVIVAHGYRKNRMQDDVPVLKLASQLHEKNYHLLLFDFRNSGESGGNLTSVGQFETYDLLGAVDWVKVNKASKIVLLGYSMGGATSILAAAQSKDIAAVIADSSFHDLSSYLSENLSVWSGLPEFPFTPLIMSLIPPVTGTNPDAVSPIEKLADIYPRPILFIHGKKDKSIPYQSSQLMHQKFPERFSLWLTESADHVDSYKHQPTEYLQKIDQFIQRNVLTNFSNNDKIQQSNDEKRE